MIKKTKIKPMIRRFHVKSGQLPLLTRQATLLRIFCHGSLAVAGAVNVISKCLKFLKFCYEDEEELTFDIVDFSLCSLNLLFKFVDTMQDDWKLGHAGRIGYLDAIAELGDYRKLK